MTVDVEKYLAERARRTAPVSMRGKDFQRRVNAEHEAAHAIVAWALGLHVREARISDTATGANWTDVDFAKLPAHRQAPVWLAGDIWIDLFADPYLRDCYRDSHGDRDWCAANLDDYSHREAYGRAVEILRGKQAQVHELAERLCQERSIKWPAAA